MRGTDARRRLAGILVPALVLLHTLCLCAGVATAEPAPAAGVAVAAPCPDHPADAAPEPTSSPHDATTCPHCGAEASLAVAAPPSAASAVDFAAPYVATLPSRLAAATVVVLRIGRPSAGPPASMRSVLSRSAVLRI